MKPKFFLIFLIILTILNYKEVKANEWTSTLPLNEKIEILESKDIYKYRWYKLEEVNIHYEIDKLSCEYSDLNNYIYSEYSDWTYEYPDMIDGRIIEESIGKIEFNNSTFEQIIVDNFEVNNLYLKEINIINKIKNEAIAFTILSCENCKGDLNNVNDENYNTGVVIDNNTKILLDINTTINYDNIVVSLEFDLNDSITKWKTSFIMNKKYIVKSIVSNTNKLTKMCYKNYCKYETYLYAKYDYFNVFETQKYRYKDKLFKCFEYEKKYIDGYYENLEGYIKDDENYQIEKLYQYDINNIKCKTNENLITKNDDKQIIGVVNDSKKGLVGINYSGNKKSRNYDLWYAFVVVLFTILLFLIIICKKMKKNIEETR